MVRQEQMEHQEQMGLAELQGLMEQTEHRELMVLMGLQVLMEHRAQMVLAE